MSCPKCDRGFARLIQLPRKLPTKIRAMSHDDLVHVSAVERRCYEFPWNQGVFRDCILAGYICVVLEADGKILGYSILSIAAGEAHILNLCVDTEYRHFGYGEHLLNELLARARLDNVQQVFLEVRPTNIAAITLYKKKGFFQIARRPAYYQAHGGREDACVLALKLRSHG